jgi:hypothetical protein
MESLIQTNRITLRFEFVQKCRATSGGSKAKEKHVLQLENIARPMYRPTDYQMCFMAKPKLFSNKYIAIEAGRIV